MLLALNLFEYRRRRLVAPARVILRKLVMPCIQFVPIWQLRTRLWQACGAHIHSSVWIARTALLDEEAPELITIDEGVRVSYGVMLITHSDLDKEVGPIHIGQQAWIGAGAVILPGVSIGAYSVVGAAALVNKDVPTDVRVAGVPARVIKNTGVPKEWIHITDGNYDSYQKY
ncbi:MAG: acyltransferase [Nitrospirota bacterium]|nr:acyltransferase [Nitrospirota bacterium]